ncbi:MAG: 2,3-diphosphoglycerate-dependent phosphoglycerate mutase [Candidatus Thalassarchaeaceae archaeon]|jgi:2,3-bisphosphoglycerate-dependent phosphoglycerate mutase|nr:2,3-diphosphoglycerate-dependent phosphoglycerate mutase [Candidatus Thalassarchaeaceae archaeon]
MTRLILVRHGQSVWNAANRFTGWTDVDLSDRGIVEAEEAGSLLAAIQIDVVHTSDLIRAQRTAEIILRFNEASKNAKTRIDWRLNERHYGALQGLNKAETAEEHGSDQVHIWRRSYDVAPPDGESLEMTADRTIPYFVDEILPDLHAGRNVLVSAHGNSLRSIVMHIEQISPEEIVGLEIPTGVPIHYSYEDGSVRRTE